MDVGASEQTSLYETTIENAELEQALEARQAAKERAGEARKKLKELDETARGLISNLDLDGSMVRCGRFVISHSDVAARSVSFETEPTTRLNIKLLGEE